ncbi:MAG: glycoside hydrolase family 127 protein [Kiritimatiellae bacterium]|nr:glycoside hydrolase family 127 protein [Kiritimatiellia bacterium]
MKSIIVTSCLIAVFASADTIKMLPFEKVKMQDELWKPEIQKLVTKTLPHAFKETEVGLNRLRMCAEYLEAGKTGPKPPPHPFNTSDLYKVMEGGAMMIQAEPNSEIETLMDSIIDVIARAQQKDGYLYVSHICGNPSLGNMGKRPYSRIISSHELYNIGHMYEAAVAYARATGKTKFLDVAEKSALHVNKVIFERGDSHYNDGRPVMQAPGHEEIELALLKLYNYTGKDLYKNMAQRFLDIRGVTFIPKHGSHRAGDYAQQHMPVSNQRKALGHAVRATYLYAAMAEMDSLKGTDYYSAALDSIWHDIVDTKMHISGGLGAIPNIEGFGPSYLLPNKVTYLETCAAVGNVFFNMRMFLKYRDAKYIDVAEVALLNNCLAGVGLDGTSFFYPNPLECDFNHKPRSCWFGCACCPSNIARLVPQVPGYMYAVDGDSLYLVLYGANNAEMMINGVPVKIEQRSGYPYDGDVELTLNPEKKARFKLHVRIPSWCRDRFVPGELYSFIDNKGGYELLVNDEKISSCRAGAMTPPPRSRTSATVVGRASVANAAGRVDEDLQNGFIVIDREWAAGDTVQLKMTMPLRASRCIDKVEANHDRVAFSRGPLLYCAEGVDNEGAVQRFFVDPQAAVKGAEIKKITDGPLAGLPGVTVPAQELTEKSSEAAFLKMIPYYAWSNRDRSSMMVWFGTKREIAKPDIYNVDNYKFKSVKASYTWEHDTTFAVQLKDNPKSSSDTSIPRWTSWPQKGKTQWVEIDIGKQKHIRSFGVYWYDDKGGVQVPGEWHVEVKQGDDWKKLELYLTDRYNVLPDCYNSAQPKDKTEAQFLRIMMQPQHDKTCVGILSVDVDAE